MAVNQRSESFVLILKQWLRKIDEKSRFIIVGGFGTGLAWCVYSLIYWILPFDSKAVMAWVIGFVVAVAQQHTLHRNFTFFSTSEPFLPELLRAYVAYSFGMVVSTFFHFYFTMIRDIHHQVSWVISTAISIICNFLMLKVFVFR